MKLLIYFIICNSILLIAQQDSTEKIVEEGTICFPALDSLPKPIGGLESIQNRLVYPPNALEREIEGNVYVLVKIDSLGNPSNPLLLKGIGVGCNEEAIRLVKTTKFSPAYDNGKYVNYQIMIRIQFRLPDK